ncbi:hypothetical protein ACJX0J_033382, partial [Zea mays]
VEEETGIKLNIEDMVDLMTLLDPATGGRMLPSLDEWYDPAALAASSAWDVAKLRSRFCVPSTPVEDTQCRDLHAGARLCVSCSLDDVNLKFYDAVLDSSWPGLPRGVEFNPSDSDLLWHLAAEVGNALAERHPFINEFIKFVDDVREFICTHPQHIPGVRQDGRASYFFHRSFEPYINENDVNNCLKKIGSHRSIILDGTLMGCKEVFALYADMPSDKRSQETDWRLHQYHLQNTVKAESEIVASKIFLASRNSLCELAEETHIESEW